MEEFLLEHRHDTMRSRIRDPIMNNPDRKKDVLNNSFNRVIRIKENSIVLIGSEFIREDPL